MRDLLDQLPVKTVKVGHYHFRLDRMSKREADAATNDAHTDFESQEIVMQEGLSNDLFLNRLIHEIKHAIHWFFDIEDGRTEESVTTLGANGWLMVWQDNPELFDWLNREIKKVQSAKP